MISLICFARALRRAYSSARRCSCSARVRASRRDLSSADLRLASSSACSCAFAARSSNWRACSRSAFRAASSLAFAASSCCWLSRAWPDSTTVCAAVRASCTALGVRRSRSRACSNSSLRFFWAAAATAATREAARAGACTDSSRTAALAPAGAAGASGSPLVVLSLLPGRGALRFRRAVLTGQLRSTTPGCSARTLPFAPGSGSVLRTRRGVKLPLSGAFSGPFSWSL